MFTYRAPETGPSGPSPGGDGRRGRCHNAGQAPGRAPSTRRIVPAVCDGGADDAHRGGPRSAADSAGPAGEHRAGAPPLTPPPLPRRPLPPRPPTGSARSPRPPRGRPVAAVVEASSAPPTGPQAPAAPPALPSRRRARPSARPRGAGRRVCGRVPAREPLAGLPDRWDARRALVRRPGSAGPGAAGRPGHPGPISGRARGVAPAGPPGPALRGERRRARPGRAPLPGPRRAGQDRPVRNPAPPRHPPGPDATRRLDALRAILDTLDPQRPTDVRDRVLLIGFTGALRRSERAALDLVDLVEDTDGLRLFLARSRTDPEATGGSRGLSYARAPAVRPGPRLVGLAPAPGSGRPPGRPRPHRPRRRSRGTRRIRAAVRRSRVRGGGSARPARRETALRPDHRTDHRPAGSRRRAARALGRPFAAPRIRHHRLRQRGQRAGLHVARPVAIGGAMRGYIEEGSVWTDNPTTRLGLGQTHICVHICNAC